MLWAYLRLWHCVFVSASVCETTIHGVNSCRHPRHQELIVAWVCVRVRCGLFFVWATETTAVPTTMLREAERLCLWRRLFVVVGRQEMRSCWGLWLRARRAYQRAGPGQEENTNHLLAGLAGLMEMRKRFIQCNVSKQGGICGYTRHGHLFPALSLNPLLISLNSNPPFMSQSIVVKQLIPHTKTIYHSKTPPFLIPKILSVSFTSSYSIWRLHRGHRVEHCSWLPKTPPFSFHTPSFLCLFMAYGNWAGFLFLFVLVHRILPFLFCISVTLL